jgi:putative transposase
MAKEVVQQRGLAIRLACAVFSISESCYRYESKQNAENALIADWLIRLTDNHRNWGFSLSYLYLRNVKNFRWNHKRVYRIYRELELNLRIKPRKRLIREKPEPLAVPQAINQVWSMDFTHDKLEDGRNLRFEVEVEVEVAPLDRTHYCSTKGVSNETKKRGISI